MAKDIWESGSIWDEDYDGETLSEDEVIIQNDTPAPVEEEDDDEEWYMSLIEDSVPEEQHLKELKSDSYLSSWVPSAPVKKANISDNAKYAYNYYTNKGLPSHVAAGIVGNLMKESGVNPNTKDGDRRGGIGGIAQWDPTRSANLIRYGESSGRSAKDLDTQLDFVLHEASQRGDLDATMSAKTPEEAAVIFGRKYERPNEKYADWGTRQQNARSLSMKHGGVVSAMYGINNIPLDQLEDVTSLNTQMETPDRIESPTYTPNPVTIKPPIAPVVNTSPIPAAADPESSEGTGASVATTVIDGVKDTIDKTREFRNKVARINDNISRGTSEAIDFQNEIAGIQRDNITKRKFNQLKNQQKYTVNKTNLNQPLIYT